MDHLAAPDERWQQAAYCRKRGDAAADEQVRALWIAMARMWTKFAEKVDQMPQGAGSLMTRHDKPKSRLQTHAPQCAQCRAPMKLRILFPGRKVDDVTYRCYECGAEVMRSVPRPQ
jgi:hypothetical protein